MTIRELQRCELIVNQAPWPFAVRFDADIAAHWAAATARNPDLFNGDVFVLPNWVVEQDGLRGTLLPTKFAAYNYWRDRGYDGGETSEAFATTVIVTSDDGVFLARSVAGTLNGGLFASPGGLLDRRDVRDNRMDVAAAAARELHEETGLDANAMSRDDGYLLAHVSPFLALASVFRTPLSGADLVKQVTAFLKKSDAPELEAPLVVYHASELANLPMAPHARLLSAHILA